MRRGEREGQRIKEGERPRDTELERGKEILRGIVRNLKKKRDREKGGRQ
jgi:hypothetical protein